MQHYSSRFNRWWGSLSIQERTECLEAYPEMASLNMGTMVRTIGEAAGTPFMNTRSEIENFVKRMNEFGVKPEMEVYNISMLYEVKLLIEKGLIQKPYCISLILGMAYQGAQKLITCSCPPISVHT